MFLSNKKTKKSVNDSSGESLRKEQEQEKSSEKGLLNNITISKTHNWHLKNTSPLQIKSFASISDAESHGWYFKEVIGKFNNKNLFKWAFINNSKWIFNGLYAEDINKIVVLPDNIRLFGKLCYKKID